MRTARVTAETPHSAQLSVGALPWLATVPAVAIADGDPAQTRGQLLATRLVLQEALGRLSAEQIADLQAALETVVTGLRVSALGTAPPGQMHIADEPDAISLRLRYRDQPIEHPTAIASGLGVSAELLARAEYTRAATNLNVQNT